MGGDEVTLLEAIQQNPALSFCIIGAVVVLLIGTIWGRNND